ncbi:MAG: ferredoxin family protein [Coriobacteriia bacterium]|nr:ferredoxin family protein [Coriobacteriia bacterium]
MQGLRYLEDAVTLALDAEKCTGCRQCTLVCPHGVFAIGPDKRAYLADRGACMECGACAMNCSSGAISVEPGVGCAAAIIHSWIYGGEPTCGCSTEGASAGGSCCGDAPAATAAPSTGCCASVGPVMPPVEPRELAPRAVPQPSSCCSSSAGPTTSGERAAPS